MGCNLDYHTVVANKEIQWMAPHSTHWDKVWVSAEFQELMTKPSWLRDDVMPYISSRPLGWFEPPQNARFYFSSWLMNCVMRRNYPNPLIQDLYVLHEALHAASLDEYFLNAKTPADALRSNEIQVSLETECWMYLRHPEWIGRTFSDLWIVQPHIQQQIKNADVPEQHSSMQEIELHALAQKASWPILPPSKDTANRLWWVRRHMNTHAQTPADHTVARYERMAGKWIAQIAEEIMVVQTGRFKFNTDLNTTGWKTAVDNWSEYLNQHIYDGLPFGNLQLRSKV